MEKIAPAMTAAAPGLGLEIERPLGRLLRERREIGFVIDCFGGELMLMHLAFRMAMEEMVAIGNCSGVWMEELWRV